MDNIKKIRLDFVLNLAEIDGSTFKIRNDIYEKALGLSSKGYTVWIKRDVDEIYTNNYNPEWIKAWNANMDLKPCFDYFAVITYITDYYMKDESGTVGVMKEQEVVWSEDRRLLRMARPDTVQCPWCQAPGPPGHTCLPYTRCSRH